MGKTEDKQPSENNSNAYSSQLEMQLDELQKKHEECIRQKAVEKFASVSRMMRTVAHEIRNPLTNIGLALEQLNAEMPANEDASLLTEMMQRNTVRINILISELLEATKFAQLNLSITFINDLLEETIGHVKSLAEHKNATVEKHFCESLPALLLDKEKTMAAFENLFTNALESVAADGGKINVVTANESGKCVITIHHNGSIISPEKKERLFEPYFLSKGSEGLLLTQTQNIILNHGGNIDVESEPGKGTTFTVVLEFA